MCHSFSTANCLTTDSYSCFNVPFSSLLSSRRQILDFSKAFDRVPHRRVLRKLHHYRIREQTHAWIADFLRNRKQRVVVKVEESEAGPIISRVSQGTVLGPILFLLFINDLPKRLSSKTRLFAHVCIVYTQVNNQDDYIPL